MNPSGPDEQVSVPTDNDQGCELLDSVPVVNSVDPLFSPDGNDEDWWTRALIEALRFAPPFPLPPVPKPPRPTSFFSRRVRARFAKALALWSIADRCVQTLNEVEGSIFRQFGNPPVDQRLRCNLMDTSTQLEDGVRLFHLRMLRAAALLRDGRRAWPTGARWQEMFSRLCFDTYQRESDTKYEPVIAARMAEPAADAGVVSLLEWLPPGIRDVYSAEGRVMRPGWPGSKALADYSLRYDSVLGKRSEYVKYFSRDGISALWDFQPAGCAKATMSFAAVGKGIVRT